MFRSAISVFFSTCRFLWKSKIMAFIIYHLENGICRLFGYSSYVFNFFYLAYYPLIAFFTIEYVDQIYQIIFAPLGGTYRYDGCEYRYDSIRALHAYAEILEQEDILISVRNLYHSEPNNDFEFLPRLKSDLLPQTFPQMLSFYKKLRPHFASKYPTLSVRLMAPLARNLLAPKSIL